MSSGRGVDKFFPRYSPYWQVVQNSYSPYWQVVQNSYSPNQKTTPTNYRNGEGEGEKNSPGWRVGFYFLLAKPEFYWQLASGYPHPWLEALTKDAVTTNS
jgi:hypothetical protein